MSPSSVFLALHKLSMYLYIRVYDAYNKHPFDHDYCRRNTYLS
jgi:hypothetical protein